jgi:hypothetical protein
MAVDASDGCRVDSIPPMSWWWSWNVDGRGGGVGSLLIARMLRPMTM